MRHYIGILLGRTMCAPFFFLDSCSDAPYIVILGCDKHYMLCGGGTFFFSKKKVPKEKTPKGRAPWVSLVVLIALSRMCLVSGILNQSRGVTPDELNCVRRIFTHLLQLYSPTCAITAAPPSPTAPHHSHLDFRRNIIYNTHGSENRSREPRRCENTPEVVEVRIPPPRTDAKKAPAIATNHIIHQFPSHNKRG